MSRLSNKIYGCVLIGGRSRRFGGMDKSQLLIGEATLLDHVIRRAQCQVEDLALSSGSSERTDVASFTLPVLRDEYDQIGPMAGLHACLKWAQRDAGYIATFACDTPSFPADMVKRLVQAAHASKAPIALPRNRGRVHTALGLWSTALLPELVRAIDAEKFAFTRWAMDNGAALVDFEDTSKLEFFNINTPEDAEQYRHLLEQ
ncbi:molybdenum cofactor guanylyltransferase [Allopontixanthobacter sp.]|uniref:molybdenum cofactor guanylyltransferase n=1 Tax=Allopontixanthobacter sp. TaxID=2906452 RepID=UPI002AB931DD|nr:molybdenum cofactor guanylyltransferase [Allopontixanthobacter sp.]MDZ4307166.1 molybdenum cofactor guanylyltransferase [Allopontixanthobacter sp.]